MNYGVARKLLEFIPFAEMTIIPHLSAFSLAAARMGWSLPDCDTLTLHGRDAANIEAFIQPGAQLIVAHRRCQHHSRSRTPAGGARLWQKRDHRSRKHGRRARSDNRSFVADAVPNTDILRSQHARRRMRRRSQMQKSGRALPGLPDEPLSMTASSPSAKSAPQRSPPWPPPPINCCGMSAPAAARSPSNGCARTRGCEAIAFEQR